VELVYIVVVLGGGIIVVVSIIVYVVIEFTLVSNSVVPFWKLLVSKFLFGLSETLHFTMSASHVKIVPLLDVHQLLMLFAGTLTYPKPVTFS
jgi:hypothetical protein